MAGKAYFTADGMRFFEQLAAHNDKAWFEKNKARYEAGMRDPALRLLGDVGPILGKISKRFVVDPRPSGGSLSRIHRDTRFSKDKSPYKTHLFVHIRHEDGDEDAAPGFFMRLGPGGESRVGAGIWHPAPPKLAKIRQAIATDAAGWKSAKQKSARGTACMLEGDALKKVPKGFDPEHVHADDLKRRDFGASVALGDATLTSGRLLGEIDAGLRAVAPVVSFLCRAVGLSF